MQFKFNYNNMADFERPVTRGMRKESRLIPEASFPRIREWRLPRHCRNRLNLFASMTDPTRGEWDGGDPIVYWELRFVASCFFRGRLLACRSINSYYHEFQRFSHSQSEQFFFDSGCHPPSQGSPSQKLGDGPLRQNASTGRYFPWENSSLVYVDGHLYACSFIF